MPLNDRGKIFFYTLMIYWLNGTIIPFFIKKTKSIQTINHLDERTSCSNVLLTLLFGIREQTIYEIMPKLLPLLHDRFIQRSGLA